MNSPRLTIATMMCFVGIVAVSLAVGRALFASEPWLAAGVCLAGLAIQVGLFRIVRVRGRSRAFWAGFVVCGTLAASSFAGGMIVSKSIVTHCDAATGQVIKIPITILEQVGSTSWTMWRGYL
jgi:hypothetical protein